jgi:hypothetical protein
MSKMTLGIIVAIGIVWNLIVVGSLLFLSWFDAHVAVWISPFLLTWFLLNTAIAYAAFVPPKG